MKEQRKGFLTPNIENRKAYHDYFIEDKIECGISLVGNEVKSIREGSINIKNSWVRIINGQAKLLGVHIKNWETSNSFDLLNEDRERILLLHKKEIRKLAEMVDRDGYTLVPLKVYFNERGKCKVLLGVCRGKHNYDKRNSLKERQVSRDIARNLKGGN